MGGGSYSSTNFVSRSTTMGYKTKSTHEIFTQRQINNAMNPYGIKFREARDSAEHPESLAIIVALDVTGSMGSVPHYLVSEGMNEIMATIIDKGGIKDPQLLFMGIGDQECDNAPLQVAQFESSDAILDKWLKDVYLEGGGGGNEGESYLLAWYFAAYHTAIDCFEKRKKKGFLFTIGDEPTLRSVPRGFMKKLMGDGQYEDFSADQLFNKAREKYNVYHLHITETAAGSRKDVQDGWKQLMGPNVIFVQRKNDVSKTIAEIIMNESKGQTQLVKNQKQEEETKITL